MAARGSGGRFTKDQPENGETYADGPGEATVQVLNDQVIGSNVDLDRDGYLVRPVIVGSEGFTPWVEPTDEEIQAERADIAAKIEPHHPTAVAQPAPVRSISVQSKGYTLGDQDGSWLDIEASPDGIKLRSKRGQTMTLANTLDVQALIDILTDAAKRLAY